MTLPVSVPTPEELDEHKEKDKEPSSLPYSGISEITNMGLRGNGGVEPS